MYHLEMHTIQFVEPLTARELLSMVKGAQNESEYFHLKVYKDQVDEEAVIEYHNTPKEHTLSITTDTGGKIIDISEIPETTSRTNSVTEMLEIIDSLIQDEPVVKIDMYGELDADIDLLTYHLISNVFACSIDGDIIHKKTIVDQDGDNDQSQRGFLTFEYNVGELKITNAYFDNKHGEDVVFKFKDVHGIREATKVILAIVDSLASK